MDIDPPAEGRQEEDDIAALSAEERKKIMSLMEKMLEMGIGCVYGEEDEGVPEADVDCTAMMSACGAKCCTFSFALTKDEVKNGFIKHDPRRPFFIARDADGYCAHFDRVNFKCSSYECRPLRCRRYDCRDGGQK